MIALAPSHRNQLQNYTSWLEKRNFPYRILTEGDTLEGYSLLMLCGGPDVGSAGKRDQLELCWFRQAYGKIPVLGICRGLQLSNVALGGTLYEDLSEDPVKHTSNKKAIAGEPSPVLECSWHNVIMGDKEFKVNSRHHQGIKNVAPGLKVLGVCTEDKLPEIIEGENALFVQWHPERSEVWGSEAESIVYEWLKERVPFKSDDDTYTYVEQTGPVQLIQEYFETKGFSVVSYQRIQKSINSSYDSNFVDDLIQRNPSLFKKVKDKEGRDALKIKK